MFNPTNPPPLFTTLLLLTITFPSALAINGNATFYGGNLSGGNCMFSSYSLPSGVYGTAIAGPNWNSAAQCGACVRVTGPQGNFIKAMIVDQCPGCAANHLDLFQNAFGQLAPLQAGIIPISWEVVPCGISGPLTLRAKDGASQWWFSLQAFNANHPITGLEVSTSGGNTWQSTARRDYNYFEKSSGGGFGTQAVAVRVSCANGAKVTVQNVGVNGGIVTQAGGNC
ncbi:RlpA-like double-psi beta-barrel-protein domain-containing protein-containing protein [Podospora aff. communis PSN243]|uniref:RlpA-like double-psi beta-barrel-protein domain-containing protein-containing protein n=1 Tax=Podospora aff. communis PSN243 TaxID=3040156 RepID=A0AAV9GF85_9PEZI|nr:RlpA-like double-psi beta-barrel-protein domain-containing protein-containing protein [Podospora aff. communis PSN243]